MIINTATLDAIRVGFNAAYKRGLGQAQTQYGRVATTVRSTTGENRYGWLGKMPNMREWIGPRAIQGIAEHDYSVKNKDFELTIGVDRNDIKDDNLGIYDPMFVEMGESVTAHPDILVWNLLKAGFTTPCYDGQNYFDTDHPVILENGTMGTVANTDGGAGAPWYLMCTNRSLKPILHQEREKATFVAMDKATDANVFNLKQYLYGVDGRWNVGFGFWQMAWGSKQTLNADNYASARAALSGMKGDYGRPLGLVPNLLVVPPSMESAARKLLNSEYAAGGETNEWKGTAELLVVPWLA
ncbi:Mu-like prophage major head subunit gpT family protein [Oceaniglobus trochenteri]|uniref:Mu-like prophage major head subunit gpT family protein n=1 Tax=Oceaniglobus trochenteri TaxID=2763260 RepID=UPI001D000003|nr:Mu-like prophage major head subunit gpT family protein [Oceaniglobus trochenteri]